AGSAGAGAEPAVEAACAGCTGCSPPQPVTGAATDAATNAASAARRRMGAACDRGAERRAGVTVSPSHARRVAPERETPATLPWREIGRVGGDEPMRPGQPDMHMILQQAEKVQRQLAAAQEELAETEVTGQAGNGLVTVTRTAAEAGEFRKVTIDPKVVDPTDVETLEDLVLGAIEDADRAAERLREQKLGGVAGGLGELAGGLGLPGLGGLPGSPGASGLDS